MKATFRFNQTAVRSLTLDENGGRTRCHVNEFAFVRVCLVHGVEVDGKRANQGTPCREQWDGPKRSDVGLNQTSGRIAPTRIRENIGTLYGHPTMGRD